MLRHGPQLSFVDLVFSCVIAAFAGAAIYAVTLHNAEIWARQDGRSDWLGFWGAVLGALVTGASIFAAWRIASHQVATQQDASTWATLYRLHERLAPELVGLTAARNFCIYLFGSLLPGTADEDLFAHVAKNMFDATEKSVAANIPAAVKVALPSVDDRTRKEIEVIIGKIRWASVNALRNISAEADVLPGMAGYPKRMRMDAEKAITKLIEDISSRIDEIEDLEFIAKFGQRQVIRDARKRIEQRRAE